MSIARGDGRDGTDVGSCNSAFVVAIAGVRASLVSPAVVVVGVAAGRVGAVGKGQRQALLTDNRSRGQTCNMICTGN